MRMFSFCLRRWFVVDIVDVWVGTVSGLCEHLTMIRPLDSCIPTGLQKKKKKMPDWLDRQIAASQSARADGTPLFWPHLPSDGSESFPFHELSLTKGVMLIVHEWERKTCQVVDVVKLLLHLMSVGNILIHHEKQNWKHTCSQRIRFAQTVHQWLFVLFLLFVFESTTSMLLQHGHIHTVHHSHNHRLLSSCSLCGIDLSRFFWSSIKSSQ